MKNAFTVLAVATGGVALSLLAMPARRANAFDAAALSSASPEDLKIAVTAQALEAASASAVAASARASAAVASASASVASASAAHAADAKNTAESLLDQARAGRLIRNGVTVGAAFTVQGPSVWGSGGASTSGWNVGWMPYLAFAPAYWFQTTEHTLYCASQYDGNDSAAATRAAFSQSKQRYLAAHPEVQRELDSANSVAEKDRVWAKIEAGMADDNEKRDGSYWNPSKGAGCTQNKFGFYVGIPNGSSDYAFTSNSTPQEAKVNVSSIFSFGMVFIPTSYVSFLGGLTYGQFTEPATAPAVGADRRVLSLVFGVGGNADLFNSSIFK